MKKIIDTYPHNFNPIVTMDDYKRGYIFRYFVKQKTGNIIIEIDKQNFEKYNTPFKTSLTAFFEKISIRWIISGTREDVQDKNNRILVRAEKDIQGIRLKLGNVLQFWEGQEQWLNN